MCRWRQKRRIARHCRPVGFGQDIASDGAVRAGAAEFRQRRHIRQEITGLTEDQTASFRGRTIGIVFQSFHLIPNMTALENVAVPLELAGHADPMGRARAELAAVGLAERVTHYPGELSGGEQQRVAIARALAPEPSILIADEPTGNLDLVTGEHITDLIFKAQQGRGMTLLLVTHDQALAARCDRQVRMRSGQIETDAPKAKKMVSA